MDFIKKLYRKITPALLYTLLVLTILILHTFFSDVVNVDRHSAWFLALLFIMLILPSIKKGNIAYFFSFERDLERAREAVRRLGQKDGAKDAKVKENVQEKIKNSTDETNPCLTSGKIRQQIKKRLYEIQERWLKETEKLHDQPAEDVAEHLHEKGYLSNELFDAVHEILTICKPLDYYSVLKREDVQKIINTSLPVLDKLHELSGFYEKNEN